MPTVVGYKTVLAKDVPIGCMFRNSEEDGLFLRINLTGMRSVVALVLEPIDSITAVPAYQTTPWNDDEAVLLITEWEET